jgi:hypothetical protein
MAKSNSNFYLLLADRGDIIGVVRSQNVKEDIRNALQDHFEADIVVKDHV